MRGLTLTAVCGVLVLAGGLTAAPIPKEDKKEKSVEQKLIGKWKLVKTGGDLSEDFTFVIEYKEKGAMTFIRTPKDKDADKIPDSEGKWKMDGDDKIEWTVSEGGRERGETSKIKTLTEDKLVLEDPEGIKEEFEKVTDKKKDDKKDPKKDDKKDEKPKKKEEN